MSQSKHVQFAATALALAMSAAASAQTANVELAGQLGISITHKNNQTGGGSLNDVGDNALAASWFRISGSENLGGGMRVRCFALSRLSRWTQTTAALAAGKLFNRQAWVGLDTGATGAITVGRQFHAATDRAIPLVRRVQFGRFQFARHAVGALWCEPLRHRTRQRQPRRQFDQVSRRCTGRS